MKITLKNKTKNFIALFMSLLMVLVILPISAIAEEKNSSNSVYFPSKLVDKGSYSENGDSWKDSYTSTYTYNNGTMTCKAGYLSREYNAPNFSSLFMLPKDTNLRNIALCATIDFSHSPWNLPVLLSDAATTGKIKNYIEEDGSGVNYYASNGKLNSLKYDGSSKNSTIQYSDGNVTNITLYCGDDTDPIIYNVTYNNGAISSVVQQNSSEKYIFNYSTDNQKRATQIKYVWYVDNKKENVGTLKFSYNEKGNLTRFTNNWYNASNSKDKYVLNITLTYNSNNLVSKINAKSKADYYGDHTVTATYQKL